MNPFANCLDFKGFQILLKEDIAIKHFKNNKVIEYDS